MSQLLNSQLFHKDLILFTDVSSQEELFTKVGEFLLQKGLVNPGYVNAVIEREKLYPTGLDLGVVGPGIPNVAIPHTETEFCNAQHVVVVRNQDDLDFHNMIAPDQELKVSHFFFILNHNKNGQTNILSNLMAFFTQNDHMKTLSTLSSAQEIYDYLNSNEGVQSL